MPREESFYNEVMRVTGANDLNGDYYTRLLNALRRIAAVLSDGDGGFIITVRDVQLRNNGTYIQWKYSDEPASAWRNIIALADLKGADGEDGRTPEFVSDGSYIQWKYTDETDDDWRDLVNLEFLKGEDGRTPELSVNDDGDLIWRYDDEDDDAWSILPIKFLPQGGEEGQALVKASDDDYDVKWADIEGVVTTTKYIHEQDTPSDTWLIQHNLNKFPAIPLIISEDGELIIGTNDLQNSTVNLSVVIFSEAISGKAYVYK